MKDSHSSRKERVFSTPRVSEPQCSRPKLVKSFRTSRRSPDEMSQCLLSLISVKIQGLMRAPLHTQNRQGVPEPGSEGPVVSDTHRAIMMPDTPVCLAFTASS